MTERSTSDHEEVARHIIRGRNIALVHRNADFLIAEIAQALQNAFDLGFRAAGGTVTEICRNEKCPRGGIPAVVVHGETVTPPRLENGETK